MGRYSFAKFKNTYLIKKGFQLPNCSESRAPHKHHSPEGRRAWSRARGPRQDFQDVTCELYGGWRETKSVAEWQVDVRGRAGQWWRGEGPTPANSAATPSRRSAGVAGRGGQRPSGPTHVRTLRQSHGLIIVDIASYGPHSRPRPSLSRWRAHSVFMFL